jgi:hypothetical protein
MECEKCRENVETILCRGCGTMVIRLGPFCYACGERLQNISTVETDTDDLDFSSRILCSDGACIGVVNEQGICKVCGKPYAPES